MGGKARMYPPASVSWPSVAAPRAQLRLLGPAAETFFLAPSSNKIKRHTRCLRQRSQATELTTYLHIVPVRFAACRWEPSEHEWLFAFPATLDRDFDPDLPRIEKRGDRCPG